MDSSCVSGSGFTLPCGERVRCFVIWLNAESPLPDGEMPKIEAHFKAHSKDGDWSFTREEREALGFTLDQQRLVDLGSD